MRNENYVYIRHPTLVLLAFNVFPPKSCNKNIAEIKMNCYLFDFLHCLLLSSSGLLENHLFLTLDRLAIRNSFNTQVTLVFFFTLIEHI